MMLGDEVMHRIWPGFLVLVHLMNGVKKYQFYFFFMSDLMMKGKLFDFNTIWLAFLIDNYLISYCSLKYAGLLILFSEGYPSFIFRIKEHYTFLAAF